MKPIPLSYAQQRLWFLDQLDGPSALFNMPLPYRLSGPLNLSALELALGDLVSRHEILRTVYREVGGVPYQHILAPHEAPPCLTVRVCDTGELDALVAEAARHIFDLAVDPPLRAWLFRTAEQEHTLVILLHHIAFDGESAGPLCDDLGAAYTAYAAGRTPDYEPLAIQYADYGLWQREMLGDVNDPGSVQVEQVAYWRRALADLPPETVLPLDRPRPAIEDRRGGSVRFHIDADLKHRLEALAYDNGATLFMVAQTALGVLLHRLGAGPVVPIGSVVAGRTEAGLDRLVGFFVNTLVLRTDVSGNPTFREVLARVRETDLAAYDHQDLPFDRLVETLNPVRTPGLHPLFQVALTLNTEAGPNLRLPGVRVVAMDADLPVAKFDLTFFLIERHGSDEVSSEVEGRVEYASAVFDESTARSLAGGFVRLLAQAADNPDAPLSAINVRDPGA